MTRPGTARLTAALAALVLAGCAGDDPLGGGSDEAPEGTALTAPQIRLFLRDSTLTRPGEDRTVHLYLRPDGVLHGAAVAAESEAREEVGGSWTVIDGGLLCRDWNAEWSGGAGGCARVYRYGEIYLLAPRDGAQGRRWKRSPGNTQKF